MTYGCPSAFEYRGTNKLMLLSTHLCAHQAFGDGKDPKAIAMHISLVTLARVVSLIAMVLMLATTTMGETKQPPDDQ
eukprot:COSAG02_NODE_9923_length_2074_cov_1.293165_2_plen_77_part_00